MTAESDDLRAAVASLTLATGALQVAVAELKTTLNWYVLRDREDRTAAANLDSRVSVLEKWRARIQGQIALAYFLIGLVAAWVVARVTGFAP